MRPGRESLIDLQLSARGQVGRLIRLVLLLVLLLYGIHWASQGRHWVWLVGPDAPPTRGPELQELQLKPKTR
jgi:hypothetical protein